MGFAERLERRRSFRGRGAERRPARCFGGLPNRKPSALAYSGRRMTLWPRQLAKTARLGGTFLRPSCIVDLHRVWIVDESDHTGSSRLPPVPLRVVGWGLVEPARDRGCNAEAARDLGLVAPAIGKLEDLTAWVYRHSIGEHDHEGPTYVRWRTRLPSVGGRVESEYPVAAGQTVWTDSDRLRPIAGSMMAADWATDSAAALLPIALPGPTVAGWSRPSCRTLRESRGRAATARPVQWPTLKAWPMSCRL
jgi:hypothetical protein